MKLRIASLLGLLIVLLLVGCAGNGALEGRSELLVGSSNNGKILRYDLETGDYLGVFASGGHMLSPNGMAQLTNGDLVVGDFVTQHILEYNKNGLLVADLGALNGTPFGLMATADGGFLVSEFDSDNKGTSPKIGRVVKYTRAGGFQTFAKGGSLSGPDGLTTGPDGNLYVSSENSAQILKYSLAGDFLGVFASGSPLGAPNAGPSGTTFGPDGNFYVAQHDTNPVATTNGMVLRYNGTTGAFMDQVVPMGSGGLSGPVGVLFSPDGRLLVTSAATNQILSYSVSGSPLGVFATSADLSGPIYMTVFRR